MSKLVAERINEPWKRRLYLPAYEVGVSARYAQIPAQTVSRWHILRSVSALLSPIDRLAGHYPTFN